MKKMAFVVVLATLGATSASAGVIESACNRSDRKAASRQLCGCIQEAADLTLTGQDQKVAAAFFKDPHRAQQTRQSDNRRDEAFWQRYKQFGTTAQAFCSGV